MVVANIYEIYNLFNSNIFKDVSNECLKNNFIKVMIVLIPFTPHLARECLEKLGEKNVEQWPLVDKKLIKLEKIKIAIQINGKTRDVLEFDKDMDKKNVIILCKKSDKIKNKILNQNIKNIIFVKNRIVNFII